MNELQEHSEAFELRQELAYLLRFAILLTRSKPDAEDLVQETYLRVASSRRGMRSRRAYLRQVLINLHIDQQRRQSRSTNIPDDPTTSEDPDPFRDLTDNMALQAAMSRLPLIQQQILLLRYVEELNSREIAALLNRPSGTVRRTLAEALRSLQADTSLSPIERRE